MFRAIRNIDKSLLLLTFALFAIGFITIYSATHGRNLPLAESFYFKQLTWFAIGLIFLLLALAIPYQSFIDASYAIYAINIMLLVLVLMMGHIRLGAQRWFSIAGFAFQPSEFLKLGMILAFSNYLGSNRDQMGQVKSLIIPCIMMGLPFVLVVLQPDLGTALLLVPIFFAMLLVAGAKPRHLTMMILAGVAAMPVFWQFLREYQKQRLLVFINPNIDPLGAGYTIIQSKIAIGSGGLFGKGWLGGTQTQLNFLPERHTDFIFSAVGEEWGLIGATVVVLLYVILVNRAFIASSLTSDLYGKLIATGIAVMIAFQVLINIAMTVGMMPVVGIPLPMISYGGSSMLTTMIAVGLLMNVSLRRSTF
jgi:rod shape determining protein RodA